MKRIGPDEKITRTILNALEELANERRKWEEKRNAKLWAEIEGALDFGPCSSAFHQG